MFYRQTGGRVKQGVDLAVPGTLNRVALAMKKLIELSRRLCLDVEKLSFAEPVTHVYNPLRYARRAHESYLRQHANKGVRAVLIGMNPGPFGMAQTGVPFGEVEHARDWLKVDAKVGRPPNEHPKRPVEGFACERSEVSGARLWGWAKSEYKTPAQFFRHFFVINYCPLVFMEASARNRTPDKLPKEEREPLEAACDRALYKSVIALEPEWVIGVGAFAEKQAKRVFASEIEGRTLKLGRILHPSPASPVANRGWAPQASAQLRKLGL